MAGVPFVPKRRLPAYLHGGDASLAASQARQNGFSASKAQSLQRLSFEPDVQRFADLREKTGTMMIYHRFMCENGHFRLLELISCVQYRHYRRFPQTTLC